MILTADIGTSFIKASLVETTGQAEGRIAKIRVHRLRNRFSDITDTSAWEASFARVMSDLDVRREDIDAVIITGNGPTLAPSCGGRTYLYSFSDAREESEEIRKTLGLELGPSMFLPKALYIRKHDAELWERSDWFMSSPEYLSYLLTGVPRTVLALEGLEKWYWKDEWLEALGIEKSKFPPFIRTGERLGRVTTEASHRFGIREGVPVLAGCPDFVPAIVGSGAMRPGMVCNRSGSSEGLNYCSAKKTDDPFYMCYRHPNGIDWNISAVIPRGFLQIDTEKSRLGFDGFSYTDLFEYINSPVHMDEEASRGMRHACEALCHELGVLLGKISDGVVTEIRVSGAPSKYAYLNQLRADSLGARVSTIDTSEAGLQGLGIIAISALSGEDVSLVAQRVVKIKDNFLPNRGRS